MLLSRCRGWQARKGLLSELQSLLPGEHPANVLGWNFNRNFECGGAIIDSEGPRDEGVFPPPLPSFCSIPKTIPRLIGLHPSSTTLTCHGREKKILDGPPLKKGYQKTFFHYFPLSYDHLSLEFVHHSCCHRILKVLYWKLGKSWLVIANNFLRMEQCNKDSLVKPPWR